MFPFRFDWNEQGFDNKLKFYKKQSIDERVNLSNIKDKLEKSKWDCKSFDLKEKQEAYNEYAYFYDYARDAIYNQSISEDSISYFFQRKDDLTNASYKIHIKKDKKCYTYNLNITGLSLRIFHSGVAILSIELENRQTNDFEDILRINDYGRRIYPQFIGGESVIPTKNAFLADYISIKTSDLNITENFEYINFSDTCIGHHILELLGTELFTQNKSAKNRFYIQPILDDRMFVLSWYGNDDLSNRLVDYNYISDNWYKYVFVDGNDKTVFSPKMQEKLIIEATYDRWMNYEYGLTLYGVSRYSFVCLSNNSDFTKNILPRPHLHTMYFQMISLLLASRASILRFSDEIAAVANSKNLERLQPLYERYLTFYNRLYFKEVTHQEQGIELYDIAREQMRIDNHIEKLDGKFTKLFEYAELQNTKKEQEDKEKMQNLFNLVSGLFIFPSLI